MSSGKPNLFLTIDDPYAIYGPGEKIAVSANLDTVNPVLAKYIIVSLLAGCRVTASTSTKPAKQTFFHKQFKVPFHNKREDPGRQLSQGQHKWDFEFRLPSANGLPPSFCYRDQDGSAEILYCLVACIYKSNSTGPTKENMCTLPIKYSPKRSPGFAIDCTVAFLCQPLMVKLLDDGRHPYKTSKRIPHVFRRIVNRNKICEERLHITLSLPAYAAFTEHMDISIKVETADDDPLRYVQARLVKVEYRLWAITGIVHQQESRTHRHQIQSNSCSCSTLLDTNCLWASLRRHAPFRVQPRLHGLPLGKDSFSSLSPSFGSQNIIREYALDVDLFLAIQGVVYRVRFEDNELVLLPHEIHLEPE